MLQTPTFPYAENFAYNFRESDYPSLNDAVLKLDWTFVKNYTAVNVALNEFYEAL